VGLRERRLGVVGIDAGQQPTLAGGAHAHVAVQQERQPPEHLLLGDGVLAGE
jgi:hypothetical protein